MEPYEGAEPYIFISYARKDAEQAAPLLDALSSAGYRIWYDMGIQAGAHWTETLVEKIEGCAAFCPLISRAFNASDFCFEETDYAFGEKKAIVPIYLEAMEKKELRPLYRLLHVRQDLRLYEHADPVQFAERLGREQAFAPCKVPEWHKVGQIQWRFADGVLTIAKHEHYWSIGSIPAYQLDLDNIGSIAPWMPYREKIRSVEILDNIATIGDYAFSLCNNLRNAHIPDSVIKIGKWAFSDCYSLTDVRIPDSVTKIGDCAFAFCISLTEVRVPNGVITIEKSTFMHCHSLIAVCISDSVTKIDVNAFESCKNLTDVHIPDSVSKIADFAFSGCENLKSVEIPAGTEVAWNAFPEHTRVTRRGVTKVPDEKNA